MALTVVVLGAGGPAGVNVCRALKSAGHVVFAVDENADHLVWCRPVADLVATDAGRLEGSVDVWYAQPDSMLVGLAESGLPKLMPSVETIEICADKAAVVEVWHDAGIRSRPPVRIGEEIPDHLHIAETELGLPFWLRATSGAGARGATLVESLEVGYHWIRYWRSRSREWRFVAEEYLPGRDFCWTALYHEGVLIAAFTRERLEWLYPQLAPSGRTGTPTISEIVHAGEVAGAAVDALLEIEVRPHGIYCVDLRHDRFGKPQPTEINAGRWATTSPLYSELGPNMQDMHVRIAAGDHGLAVLGNDIYPEGVRLSRHIDCGHVWTNVPVAA